MIYTATEVSNITKLSKVSIYTRFKLKEIEPYLSKKQGVTYINEEGLKLITDDLRDDTESLNSLNEEVLIDRNELKENTKDLSVVKDYINTLKTENEHIYNQLKVKDSQLSEKDVQLKQKDIQISELHNLIVNSQVLLKEKPKQDILQLEEHFQDLDTKLAGIREQMEEQQVPKDQKHTSFFGKLFNNKNL